MKTELEKINLAKKGFKRNFSARELTSLAKKKLNDKNVNVWYSKNDGWWLETENDENFLGCDSRGAKIKIDELNIYMKNKNKS